MQYQHIKLDIVVVYFRGNPLNIFYHITTYKIKRGLSPIFPKTGNGCGCRVLEPATRLSRTLQPQPPSPALSVSLHLEKRTRSP